jgi:hypothetical protein
MRRLRVGTCADPKEPHMCGSYGGPHAALRSSAHAPRRTPIDYGALWQTASMLLPSGSSTNAP